jgi:hypothetical protein
LPTRTAVPCGHDESNFYEALWIVGEGLLGAPFLLFRPPNFFQNEFSTTAL